VKITNHYDMEHPLSFTLAFKGGKGGQKGPSKAQVEAEKAQAKELKDLQAKEDARVKAMDRKRQGRASLLSGDETGLKDSLGA
jgi:hypothetical protein